MIHGKDLDFCYHIFFHSYTLFSDTMLENLSSQRLTMWTWICLLLFFGHLKHFVPLLIQVLELIHLVIVLLWAVPVIILTLLLAPFLHLVLFLVPLRLAPAAAAAAAACYSGPLMTTG